LTAVRARIQLDVQTPLGGRKKTLTAALLAFVRESADANVINQRTVHAVGVRVNRLLVANGRVAAEEDADGTAKMCRTPAHSAQVDGVWDGNALARFEWGGQRCFNVDRDECRWISLGRATAFSAEVSARGGAVRVCAPIPRCIEGPFDLGDSPLVIGLNVGKHSSAHSVERIVRTARSTGN
jgi:hypothetical protein